MHRTRTHFGIRRCSSHGMPLGIRHVSCELTTTHVTFDMGTKNTEQPGSFVLALWASNYSSFHVDEQHRSIIGSDLSMLGSMRASMMSTHPSGLIRSGSVGAHQACFAIHRRGSQCLLTPKSSQVNRTRQLGIGSSASHIILIM